VAFLSLSTLARLGSQFLPAFPSVESRMRTPVKVILLFRGHLGQSGYPDEKYLYSPTGA